MAVYTPSVNTNIDIPTIHNAKQDALLKALLQGQEAANTENLAQSQHAADLNGAMQRQKLAEDLLAKYGGKIGVGVSKEGISLTPKDNTAKLEALQERKDKRIQGQQADLSKRYEKVNNFNSDIEELERLTNRDGKGGIITNPEAKLQSSGKIQSMIPDAAMGLAELIGAVPKGTSEERKALQRLQIDYQQAKSGMRVTDQARKQEASAMGKMASGDPSLQAKAIRSLGQNIKNQYSTIKSGYSPEAVENVHKSMGDPSALYQHLYTDPSLPSDQPAAPSNQPPADSMKSSGIPSFEEFKQMKRSGKLGGQSGQ